MTGRDEDPETAPYCRVASDAHGEDVIEWVLRDGEGGCVVGQLSADEARSITLALRATAAELDGKPFFDGGWSTAQAVRYAADELEELSEQYHMKTRSIENANFEGSRSNDCSVDTAGENE